MSSRSIGNVGEDAVCEMLTRHGYEILDRNFTVKGGEIDIIAKKNGAVAFVEVKTRKPSPLSSGEEAVNDNKKRHLIYAAERYLQRLDEPVNARFDVAAVELDGSKVTKIRYYVSAFDASK